MTSTCSQDVAHLRLHVDDPTRWTSLSINKEVFVPTDRPPPMGSRATVLVGFENGPRFMVRGTSRWLRLTNSDDLPAGVGIAVDPEDHETLSYIDSWTRGGQKDQRGYPRVPVRLKVVCVPGDRGEHSTTGNLSREGAFIQTHKALTQGERMMLMLFPPDDGLPVTLQGEVRHQEQEGGMGIRFIFPTTTEQERFSRFVDRLEEDLLSGTLPVT